MLGQERQGLSDGGGETRFPERVAAIDLGSNSFHLVVARATGGQLGFIDRRKESVRIAAGLDSGGALTEEAAERALECLRRYGEQVGHMPPHAVRAVGTNTLRRARNAGRFLDRAREALGHEVEVISGIEEARLVFLGASGALAADGRRRLVVDIGGGSTELVVGDGTSPEDLESLYIGCVGMSLRHFPHGAVKKKRWKRAELEARQELAPAAARFRARGWQQAVGSSGTVRAVGAIARAAGWSDGTVTPEVLSLLRRELIAAAGVPRLAGLSERRAPVLAGGAVVLSAVFKELELEAMTPVQGALREGLLYDLLGRLGPDDPRDRSVSALATRFQVDAAQAQRVADTSQRLLDQVGRLWEIGGVKHRQLLSWAARLHEIGLDIAHAAYHKHGAYVIGNADLFGFSVQEQQLVAALVRNHRRKVATRQIETLPEAWRKPAERLSILLRVAVALHRSRRPEPLPEFRATASKRSLTLELPAAWLERSPLAVADLRQAAAFLAAQRFTLRLRGEPATIGSASEDSSKGGRG